MEHINADGHELLNLTQLSLYLVHHSNIPFISLYIIGILYYAFQTKKNLILVIRR